jgi:hypothetical protein
MAVFYHPSLRQRWIGWRLTSKKCRNMGADASMHFMECAYPAPQMSENSLPCGRHMCSAALRPSRECAVDLFGLIFEGICVCLGELLHLVNSTMLVPHPNHSLPAQVWVGPSWSAAMLPARPSVRLQLLTARLCVKFSAYSASYNRHDLVPVFGLCSQNNLIFHCIPDL